VEVVLLGVTALDAEELAQAARPLDRAPAGHGLLVLVPDADAPLQRAVAGHGLRVHAAHQVTDPAQDLEGRHVAVAAGLEVARRQLVGRALAVLGLGDVLARLLHVAGGLQALEVDAVALAVALAVRDAARIARAVLRVGLLQVPGPHGPPVVLPRLEVGRVDLEHVAQDAVAVEVGRGGAADQDDRVDVRVPQVHVAHGHLGRPDHADVADPAPEPDHGRLVRLARVARPLTAGQQPLVGARPPGHAGAAALAAAGLGVGTAVPAAGLGLDLAGALDRVHEVGQPVLEVVAG